MPTIPTYESRAAVPGVAPYRINERFFLPAVQGASEIGAIMQRRGEALIEEYDTATALGAYNKLRDSARDRLNEYLQREGAAARGIQAEYDEWYTAASQKIAAQDLTVARQRDLFAVMSDRRRESDLDNLARHEAGQHRAYKKDVVQGLAAGLQADMLAAAFDETKQADMLADYFASIERLYPGRDLTAAKAETAAGLRADVARRLIVENPEFAAEYIERHKSELGTGYAALKSALAPSRSKTRVDAAIAVLQGRFGDAHELKIGAALDPEAWKDLGIKTNDEAEEVVAYFAGMQRARDYTEDRARQQKQDRMQAVERQIMLEFFDPDTPRTIDPHQALAQNNISLPFYKWITSAEAREAAQDDYDLVDEIWEDVARARYDVAKQKITEGLVAGRLKSTTAIGLSKHATDSRYGIAMQRLSDLMKPAGLFDRFANDKQLKLDESLEAVRTLAAQTDKPIEQIVSDIARGYVDSVYRSARNFRTPRYLEVPADLTPDDAKMDLRLLDDARRRTLQALNAKSITEAEYRLEMENIDTIMQYAREYAAAREKSKQIDELRKSAVKD